MKEVQIVGVGSYVPIDKLTNTDLCSLVDTSDEWISTRTGIKERRISKGEDTSDLATKAAEKALKNTGMSAEEIDLIIIATSSPDYFVPSTACIVQGKIGASRAVAFDISAACTGLIYGMNIASQFIKTGIYRTALVIGADVLSKITDWKDRNTCVLFGDGAGAVIMKESHKAGILSIELGSDGSQANALTCRATTVQNPYVAEKRVPSFIAMNGKEIFKFATATIEKSILNILEQNQYDIKDIKYVVCHQANLRIIEFVSRKLNIEKEKFYVNIDRYGNTSAASIGIALEEMIEKRALEEGDKIILVAFGGGLTWGSALIEWKVK